MTSVTFVLAPGVHLLDLAGPAQVFFSDHLDYDLHWVAEDAEVPTAQGLPVRASYAEQDGEHVAVKIDVGKGAGSARSKQHGGHPGGMQHGGQ